MKKIMGLIVLLMVVAVGTWIVADRFQSPEQVAANAEPPPPIPITSALKRGYLHAPLSMISETKHETTQTLLGPGTLSGVVTSVEKKPGDKISPGDVLMRINGEPVFALEGPFALYRDIEPNATGDDVKALQESLVDAGFSTGRDRAGVFGAGTQAAIKSLYKGVGLPLPESDEIEGTFVAADSVLLIRELPATVVSIARVGQVVETGDELATLGIGKVILSAAIPEGTLTTIREGAKGIFTTSEGDEAEAELMSIAQVEESTDYVAEFRTETSLPVGESYVISLDNPANETVEELLAHAAAVLVRTGETFIYVEATNGFTEVPVQLGESAGGVVVIVGSPAEAELDVGTKVRVGDG